MSKPKIIAMYLPQFHQIPENDEFWGKGFTDWVTVKNAKPLYEGHQQPRVPLNDNYYDLSLKENVEWQAKLAHDYGIYGFGVYHYWFNNEKNLLTKPAEIMRDDDNIETKYFFVWDNASWRRSWSNVEGNDWAPLQDKTQHNQTGPKTLIPYILGSEKDWENHYNYVKEHFKSSRYVKVKNSPIFAIYTASEDIYKMCDYWNNLARQDGYDGIHFIFNDKVKDIPLKYAKYSYAPHSAGLEKHTFMTRVERRLRRMFKRENHVTYYDYDKLWEKNLKNALKHDESHYYHGAFVAYDDSPRRGKFKAKIVKGETPAKFMAYMKELVKISKNQGKEFIFVTAWNEWGEGAYLEPDAMNEYMYLNALKEAVDASPDF